MVLHRILIGKSYRKCAKLSFQRWASTKPSYLHNNGKESLKYITIGQLLENTVDKHGDKKAIISVHQNTSITFKEALEKADVLAAGLKKIGFEKGDRLCVWGPNSIEWYVSAIAAARAGLVLVPINPAFQGPELKYCLTKVGIKGIISPHTFKTQNYYNMIKEIVPEIADSKPGKLKSASAPSLKSVILMSDDKLSGTFKLNDLAEIVNDDDVNNIKCSQHLIGPDEGCNIQFTSGTTGHPKATFTSHYHYVNNSYELGKRNELADKHHTVCLNVPLFHAFGLVISLMVGLNFGTTMVLPSPSFDPAKALEVIRDEKCTVIHGTPTMYVDLINKQKQMKLDINPEIAVSGGAPCSPHLFRQMLDVLKVKKVKSVYGLTECTAVIFQSLPGDDEHKSTATVGYVSEHVEVKVVDTNDSIVPMGTPGELCVRGYCNMLGYWGDEEKSKEIIRNDRWLRTGDQFILQEDGYGRIVGRLKDMIIRGGENIFPKEIEDHLNTHPDILEAHVIGTSHERLGEEVCACVRLREGAEITLENVKEFCKGKLAHYKIPSRLEAVSDIPKTQSGKIQKFLLKKKFDKNT